MKCNTNVKCLVVLLSIFVLLLLSGCDSKPSSVSQEAYNLGINALDVTDQYLDGKITKDEAVNKLDDISSRLGKFEEIKNNEVGASALAYIVFISANITYDGENADIVNTRNKLAKQLNK